MTWDVTVWENVKDGRRAKVQFEHLSWWLTDEFIEDAGVTAFKLALDRVPEPMFFAYGGKDELAESMYRLYRERTA